MRGLKWVGTALAPSPCLGEERRYKEEGRAMFVNHCRLIEEGKEGKGEESRERYVYRKSKADRIGGNACD